MNVLGVVQATNAFLPLLQRGSKKRIINISSGRGNLELNVATEDPTAVPYCASKYALNFVTAKYAIQLRAQGFVVLAISPGLVETEANELSKFSLSPLHTIISCTVGVRKGRGEKEGGKGTEIREKTWTGTGWD